MPRGTTSPCLIEVTEAAELLGVSPRTILGWIGDDALPHIRFERPGGVPQYRIPLHGMLRAVAGLYDLATEYREADDVLAERPRGVGYDRVVTVAQFSLDTIGAVASTTWHAAEHAPPIGAVSERARAAQEFYAHS
jgi:excisionase family DNA binding protein